MYRISNLRALKSALLVLSGFARFTRSLHHGEACRVAEDLHKRTGAKMHVGGAVVSNVVWRRIATGRREWWAGTEQGWVGEPTRALVFSWPKDAYDALHARKRDNHERGVETLWEALGKNLVEIRRMNVSFPAERDE